MKTMPVKYLELGNGPWLLALSLPNLTQGFRYFFLYLFLSPPVFPWCQLFPRGEIAVFLSPTCGYFLVLTLKQVKGHSLLNVDNQLVFCFLKLMGLRRDLNMYLKQLDCKIQTCGYNWGTAPHELYIL